MRKFDSAQEPQRSRAGAEKEAQQNRRARMSLARDSRRSRKRMSRGPWHEWTCSLIGIVQRLTTPPAKQDRAEPEPALTLVQPLRILPSSALICSSRRRSVSRFSSKILATSAVGRICVSAYCWIFKSIISSINRCNVSEFMSFFRQTA